MTVAMATAGPARQVLARQVLGGARLARIELRRNAMLWMLPVAAALFWYQAYRKTMALPPMWNQRAMTLQNDAPLDFAMPVAGAAAWMGWRESRRQMSEMLAGMPLASFARHLVSWAATTAWAVAGYVVATGVVYVATAVRAAGGGPLWWPSAVGVGAVVALSALGFTAGAMLPSRFTAPLVVIIAFFGLGFSSSGAHGSHSALMLSPLIAGAPDVGPDPGVATFYPYLPDLSIAQLMVAGGLTLALIGVLGLPARSGGWRLRACAALVAAAGVACAGTAVSLARTGTLDAHGMIRIPALHDAADDQPVRYTPACAGSPVQICMNPVYRSYLPAVVSALEPMLAEVAGLPGAPARLDQAATTYKQAPAGGIEPAGPQCAAQFALPDVRGVSLTSPQFAGALRGGLVIPLFRQVLGLTGGSAASPAQQAVFAAMTGLDRSVARESGVDPALLPPSGSPAAAAERRFGALSHSARHDWLAAHIAALRAGQLTLAQLP